MKRAMIRRLTVMALMAVGMVAFASPAWASTFTVTKTDDTNDGACDSDCSLREAITAANANGQTDTIGFALPGAAPHTITLANALTIEDDIPLHDLTIDGPGRNELTVKQSAQLRVFQIAGTATIEGITISGGRSPNDAGGILNGGDLTLNDSTVYNNQALGSTSAGSGYGGGILNRSSATLTLNRSTVGSNGASHDGGGILNEGGTVTLNDSTISGNTATFFGGGIYNEGAITVNNSTVNGNTADVGGGIISASRLVRATTTIRNSTVSANTADGGGGIANVDGLTRIENSTVTDNTAPAGNGSGVSSYGGDSATPRTEVSSTIVSANANDDDVDLSVGPANSFYSDGYNLIGGGDATAAFNQPGDRTGVTDPGLSLLQDNGGPTRTHALLVTSPALDTGTNTGCPATDQRGVKRPQREICDIGAFERRNSPPLASNDAYNAREDTTLTKSAPGVLANDTDAEDDALKASVVSRPTKGTLTLSANGSFTYRPKSNLNGTDTFTYRASDGHGGTDTATVTIEVAAVNDAPVVKPISPAPDTATTDRTPLIRAKVRDIETNLAEANIKLSVDGFGVRASRFDYDPDTDVLSYTPTTDLAFGNHTVKVVATDARGKSITEQWSFKVTRP